MWDPSLTAKFTAQLSSQWSDLGEKLLSSFWNACVKIKTNVHHRICCEDELNLQLPQCPAHQSHPSAVTVCIVRVQHCPKYLHTQTRENMMWHRLLKALSSCEGKKTLHIWNTKLERKIGYMQTILVMCRERKKILQCFDVEDSPELRHSQGIGTQCWGFRASLLVSFPCDYFISLT